MAVYLDDEAITLVGADLGAVLDGARRLAERQRRVIVEVNLNGRVLAGNELDQSRSICVNEAVVRLSSADPRELAVATLDQLGPRLDEAKAAQHEAADLFQRDKANEAIKRVGTALEVWQQTEQAISTICRLLQINLDQRRFEGKPVTDVTGVLITRITTLRDLLAARDSVALADTLEYEWSEAADQWKRLVEEIAVWVEEGGPGK